MVPLTKPPTCADPAEPLFVGEAADPLLLAVFEAPDEPAPEPEDVGTEKLAPPFVREAVGTLPWTVMGTIVSVVVTTPETLISDPVADKMQTASPPVFEPNEQDS